MMQLYKTGEKDGAFVSPLNLEIDGEAGMRADWSVDKTPHV